MANNRLQIVLHVCPSADFPIRSLLVVMAARISDVLMPVGSLETYTGMGSSSTIFNSIKSSTCLFPEVLDCRLTSTVPSRSRLVAYRRTFSSPFCCMLAHRTNGYHCRGSTGNVSDTHVDWLRSTLYPDGPMATEYLQIILHVRHSGGK